MGEKNDFNSVPSEDDLFVLSGKRRCRLTGILGCGRLAGGTFITQSSREESIKIIMDILSWR